MEVQLLPLFYRDCGWRQSASRPVRLPVPILSYFEACSIYYVMLCAIALLAFEVMSKVIAHPNTDKMAIRLPLFSYIFCPVNWCVCVEMCIRQLPILKKTSSVDASRFWRSRDEVLLPSTWKETTKRSSYMRDFICSVLHPLVVSAFTEEIPVTKMRDANRVNPRAWMHRSDT